MNILITITYNALKDDLLKPFFASILAQKDSNFRLVVIDNASTDGTVEFLRKIDRSNIKIIENSENIGFAAACNQGIALARAQGASYITFINNDVEFDSDLIGNMEKSLERNDAAGLSPLITYYSDPDLIWFITGSLRWARGIIPYHDQLKRPRPRTPVPPTHETRFAPACCLMLRLEVFDIVPNFDERFFVYWEDADLCMTMSEHGFRLIVDTTLECRHKVSVSTGGAFSDFSILHFTRGHMIFVRKHFGRLALAYVLPVIVAKTALNLLRGRMRLRQLPIWWRGVHSGLAD